MNNRELYLAWLRTTAPETYVTVMRKVAGVQRDTGGLTRDLVGAMTQPSTGFGFLGDDSTDYTNIPEITVTAPADTSPDMSQFLIDPSTFAQPPDVSTVLPEVYVAPVITPDVTPSTSGDLWTAVTKAVVGMASTALNTSAQSNLLKVNTARAQRGLAPVDANGVPIRSNSLLRAPSAAIARLESSIAGMAASPLVLLAGAGLLAFLFLKKRA